MDSAEALTRIKDFRRRMVAKSEEPELHELLGIAADALLSSHAQLERMREALAEWDRLSLVIESAVRNADWPNYQAILRAINASRAALTKEEK